MAVNNVMILTSKTEMVVLLLVRLSDIFVVGTRRTRVLFVS